jgi:hypothetical protein
MDDEGAYGLYPFAVPYLLYSHTGQPPYRMVTGIIDGQDDNPTTKVE